MVTTPKLLFCWLDRSTPTSHNPTPDILLFQRTHSTMAVEVFVPRQQWQPRVLRQHPEVLELRERLRGVSGQPSFGRLINAARTEVKETLSHHNMLQVFTTHQR